MENRSDPLTNVIHISFGDCPSARELEGMAERLNVFFGLPIDTSRAVNFDCATLSMHEIPVYVTSTLLAHLEKSKGAGGVNVRIQDDDAIVHYCLGTGFLDFFDNRRSFPTASGSNLFQVTHFSRTDPAILHDFANYCVPFLPNLPNLPNLYQRLQEALAELMENVRVHSKSIPGGCLWIANVPARRMLRFALVDFGVGISETLRAGLPYAADLVKALNGVFRVFSGFVRYRLDASRTCIEKADTRFPGTLITIDLPRVRPVHASSSL